MAVWLLLKNDITLDIYKIKAQYNLQLTKSECISVKSIHCQAVWHGQAISIYFAYFQTYGQLTILFWLFADKNVNMQPFLSTQLPDNALIMFFTQKNTGETRFIALGS